MTILSVLIDPLYLISYAEFNDLYMFGWNESGQLAQATNLARPAECFSAVEKLLMACCTMQVKVACQLENSYQYRLESHYTGPCPS